MMDLHSPVQELVRQLEGRSFCLESTVTIVAAWLR